MTEPKHPKFYNLVGHGGAVVPDMLCCEGCGYGVCSCPSEPPADVLPEGWIGEPNMPAHLTIAYLHNSGARVQLNGGLWAWYPAHAGYGARCYTPKATRDEAMATALANAEPTPAESHRLGEQMYGCVNCELPSPRECAASGHYWCSAPGRGEP